MYIDFTKDRPFDDKMADLIKEIKGKLECSPRTCKFCFASIYGRGCTNTDLLFEVIVHNKNIIIENICTFI